MCSKNGGGQWTHVMKSREVPTGIKKKIPVLIRKKSFSHGLLMLSACDLGYPHRGPLNRPAQAVAYARARTARLYRARA